MKDSTLLHSEGSAAFDYDGCNSAFKEGKMTARLIALNELIMKNEKLFTVVDVEKTGVDSVPMEKRDSKRCFTAKDRYELWKKQGGSTVTLDTVTNQPIDATDAVCPVSGETITYRDCQNGNLWEADHIIPWSKGGLTTIENGQLIKKEYNRVKSDSIPEEEEFETFALAA